MAFDKNHTTTAQKVVIIVFAIILVVSMCLPFFSSCSAVTSEASTSTSDTSSTAATTTSSDSTVSAIRSRYASIISSLENRLASNPENTTAMASLGNNYMDMAGELASASDLADDPTAAVDAYTMAVEYYDMYLAITDSNAVHVDRAISLFYSGLVDEAISDLQDYTADTGADYAPAWFNLGVMLYSEGRYEECVEAFQSAIDLDADGSAGVATNAALYQAIAQSMLDAEESAAEAVDTDSEAAADASDTDDSLTVAEEPLATEPVTTDADQEN